jgi:hypothetical protein
MSHTSIANYYSVIFSLTQHHKYSIGDLENIFPFERDIYVEMLVNYLQEKQREADRG